MKMRRLLTFALTLVIVLSIGTVHASAAPAPQEDVVLPCVDTSNNYLICPKCDSAKNVVTVDSWVEYNYYYTTSWVTLKCKDCDYTWNTTIAVIENIHSLPEPNEPCVVR